MNKQQLIDNVAEDLGLPKTVARDTVEAVLRQITNGLKENDKVALAGFGTFSYRTLSARIGRNPHTGAALDIPERHTVGFKAHKVLKAAVSE